VLYTFRRGGRPPWSHLVLGPDVEILETFGRACRKFLGADRGVSR
jgi:hypothetical protein